MPIPRYFTIVKHVRSADQTVLIAFGRAKREAPVATMTETAAVPTIRTYHMVSPTGPVFFPPPQSPRRSIYVTRSMVRAGFRCRRTRRG